MRSLGPLFSPVHLSRELVALYVHRTLIRVGLGISATFTVVFLYEYFGNSVVGVALAYASIYLGTTLLTPWTARFLNRYSLRTLIALSMPFLFLQSVSLYSAALLGGDDSFYGVGSFLLAVMFYKALYWVPYQVDMSESLAAGERGRQVARLTNSADVMVTAMPFLGGLIVATQGFSNLFVLSGILTALATLPLLWVVPRYERFEWTYRGTFARLLDARHRPLVLSHVADGIQSSTLMVLWPLMVFLLIVSEYEILGAITTLSLLAILVLRTFVGRLFDKWNKRRVVIWSALFAASGWVFKAFAGTPVHVVIVDTYHGMGEAVHRTSFEALEYDQAADSGRFVDEYTVLKEVALNLGRATGLLLFAGLAAVFSFDVAFLCALAYAAAATLTTVLLVNQPTLNRFCDE